jgi:hypothetical protein
VRALLLAILATVVVPAAFAQDVNVEFDQSVDFSQLHTFAVQPGVMRSRDPNLNNALVEKRIHTAIVDELTARQLKEVTEAPDVLVYFSLGSKERTEVHSIPSSPGFSAHTSRSRVTDGTLVLDLRRPDKKELLWRAVCVETDDDVGKVEKHLDKSVEKAFKKYPPKK